MRVASFNVQNLRLRWVAGHARLDGARDFDEPMSVDQAALDYADRRLTAAVLARADADLCVLQEVFDRPTLDYFHDHQLRATGAAPWPWRACLPGNDGAGRALAVMARRPFAATSHARLLPGELGLADVPGARPELAVFCRDCVMVELGALVVFAVHFKAPWPDPRAARRRRRIEALAVRRLIERRFDDPARAMWLVAGDLNDPRNESEAARGEGRGERRAVAPLTDGFAVDLTCRMPEAERWTWWHGEGGRGCPDALLASPALAAACPDAVPRALRLGLDRDAGDTGEDTAGGGPGRLRLADVGAHRPHASDHAALVVDLAGI